MTWIGYTASAISALFSVATVVVSNRSAPMARQAQQLTQAAANRLHTATQAPRMGTERGRQGA